MRNGMLSWMAAGAVCLAALVAVPAASAGEPAYGPEYVVVERPIAYRYHHLGPKVKCCLPPAQMILQVKDPCSCCLVNVPVCVPACCDGAPEVNCRPGLFGRSVVTYDWCCGYHLKIVFDKHGCVTVHYYGV